MADVRLQNSDGTYTNYTGVSSVTLPTTGGGTATFSSGGGGSLSLPVPIYHSYNASDSHISIDGDTLTITITEANASAVILYFTNLNYQSKNGSTVIGSYACDNQTISTSGNTLTITAKKPTNSGKFTYTFISPYVVSVGAFYSSSICEFESLSNGLHLIVKSSDMYNSWNRNGNFTLPVTKITFNTQTAVVPGALKESSKNTTSLVNEVIFGNNCTTIGNSGLAGLNIANLTIPDTITTIGQYGFRYNKATSIILGSGITSIGSYAFQYCANLTSITCKATTPPTITSDAFSDAVALTAIYVPSASVSSYQTASGWSSKSSIIQAIPS